MGVVSVRVVLVGPLDLGHDPHSVRARLPIFACARIAGLAWLETLGNFRGALRCRSSWQSHDAGLPSLLRTLDLAATLPAWIAVAWRSCACIGDVLSGSHSVGGAELRGLWTLHRSSRRFRLASSPG